jgi:PAS domain S-box-containing protein
MDTMVDVLMKLDPEGRIRMANEACYNILGYEEGEVIDKPVDYIFASPEQNEELSDMLTKGELLDRLLTQGYVKDVEIYFTTKEGEAIPMSLSASIMEDEDGSLTGIVCVAKDISERKQAEDRAEFLHSLLRHDLGNKLQVIKGNLQLLETADLPEGMDERLEHAVNGIDEATELIQNVRMLNQLEGEIDHEPVTLNVVVKEAVDRHEDLRKQVDMEVDNQVRDPVTVEGGPILKELFSNLIENSMVHSDGSTLRLSAETDEDSVVVTIEDDGTGVPDEIKEKILEKGYSGRGSTGSGLGMHLAKQIAETYDGDLAVQDSELDGARFDVTLNRATGTAR